MTTFPVLFMQNSLVIALLAALLVVLILHAGVSIYRGRTLRRYRRMLYRDDLTGLDKTTYLEQYFTDILVGIDHDVEMHYINIDNFKNYNDLLGHQFADALLKQFAQRLHALSAPYFHIYRAHSDQFVLLYPKYDDYDIGSVLHERLGEPFNVENQSITLTVSIGRYDIPSTPPTFYECLLKSELALQEAKKRGKDTFFVYDDSLKRRNEDAFKMFTSIKRALEEEQFYLEFQPIVHVKSQRLTGVESLIRIHDKYQLHFPLDVIAYAEKYNMIEDIDRFVVETSLLAYKRFKEAEVPLEFISVNISSQEIHNEKFIEFLESQRVLNDLRPGEIVIEFTETNRLENLDAETRFIKALRDAGYKVAIDDFGTGYSSMLRLSNNTLDRIKIDRTFIKDLADNEMNLSLVKSMVHLSEIFDLSLVVEGVEKESDYESIRALDIEYAQGYYFNKPMRAEALVKTFSKKEKGKA